MIVLLHSIKQNFGGFQDARQKTVEPSVEFPFSTETKPWEFLWKFHGTFHRFVSGFLDSAKNFGPIAIMSHFHFV